MFRRQHQDLRHGQEQRKEQRAPLACRQQPPVPLLRQLPPSAARLQLPTRPIRSHIAVASYSKHVRATAGVSRSITPPASVRYANFGADHGVSTNINIPVRAATAPESPLEPGRRPRALAAVICLLILLMSGVVTFRDDVSTATAQVPPPTFTPTPTATLVPFAPPRNAPGDYWADTVIGQPDFFTIAPNQTNDNKLYEPHGALVSTNTNGNGAKLFVYDANNNRILVADVATCLATPGPHCHASLVLGQPNMNTAGCNHDSGFQGFPIRAEADADTLCTNPEYVLSVAETTSGSSMALDSQGRLFTVDYFNNRVLRYPNLFGSPTPTATPAFTGTPSATPPTSTATPTGIRADRVIGQADFHSNACNRSQPIQQPDYDSHGDIVAPIPEIPAPDSNTLCFSYGSDSCCGFLGNNWVAGVDLDAQGNLWVADSGNNRVLRFHYNSASDTFSDTAEIALGQTSFNSRSYGSGLDQLTNPSVVRVNKQTGEVFVIDQVYNTITSSPTTTPTSTSIPAPGNKEYYRVMVFGPTFNEPPATNTGRLVGYFHKPSSLDFDADRPDLVWINVAGDAQLQAWRVPPAPATPSLAEVVAGGLGDSDSSIGIDNQTSSLPAPYNQLEVLLPSTSINDSVPDDVVVFGVPKSPTPLPDPSVVSTPIATPIESLFGYGGSHFGNQQTNNELAEGYGVAVSDNLSRPQLFVADDHRVLYWNDPTTSVGSINLTNGQEGTPIPGISAAVNNLKATQNYLYVSESSGASSNWIDIYRLPIIGSPTPAAHLVYPDSFRTIDDLLDPIEHYSTRPASLFIAPTSDDQYLWVGVTDDSRLMRVRNPLNLVGTGTPTPTAAPDPTVLVDVILGQQDAYNEGCNSQKVTNWTDSNLVDITDNTVQRVAGTSTPEAWDAGARSVATIAAPFQPGAWDQLKGYAQMTVDQLGYDRAFGLKSVNSPTPTPTATFTPTTTATATPTSTATATPTFTPTPPLPPHDYRNIDYAFVLTYQNNQNLVQAYQRGTPVGTPTTYATGDRLRITLENGDYGWRVGFYKNASLLTTISISPNFPYYFEASIASPGGRVSNAYLGAAQQQNMTDSTLCLPSHSTVDREGNLWVSDDSLEQQGNMRLLEYDASLFPANPQSVITALPASRIFPDLGPWEPAFDHQNNLAIGYNHYTDTNDNTHNPLPPTPLPGTPTADAAIQARFSGLFPGVYLNPLYPLPSHTSTPVPTNVYTPTPTATRPAPSPNALLADLYSGAYAATFDDYGNLYIRDNNRSRVMIYGQPGYGTQVNWATPLVNATALPSANGNSVQKTSGTDEVWNAGAVSAQAIGAGNGYIMISVDSAPTNTPTATSTPGSPTSTPGCCDTVASGTNSRRAFGLSSSSRFHAHRLQDLDYAFVLTGTNSLDVYEHGAYIAGVGTYSYDDVLKIAVEGAPTNPKVVFYQNGSAVFTITNPVLQYPLQLDTSIATLGGRVISAFISADDLVTCSASGWCTGAPQNVAGSPTPYSLLNGVAVISPNDIWAVGGSFGVGMSDTSLVEHWNGTQWSIVGLPNGADVGIVHGVSAATDGTTWKMWAVGDQGVLLYDSDSGSWSKDNAPHGGNGVYAKSTTDVWTVGSNTEGMQHFNGTSWTSYSVPAGYTFNGVTSTGGSNAWAVGFYSIANPPGSQTAIMHWNGTSWSTVTAPSPGNQASLAGVDAYDANHAWAVGNYVDAQGHTKNLTEYWDGTQWTQITAPNSGLDSELQSVHVTLEGSVWAVGDNDDLSDPNNPNSPLSHKTSVLWWNGTSWTMEETPSPGLSSSLVGLASTVGALASSPVITGTWVVGSYIPNQPYHPSTPLQSIASQTLVEFLTAPRAPITTTTYYETSISQSDHYTQGCAAGTARQGGVIVLDYGQPRVWNPGPSQLYGTLLIGSQNVAYITDPNGLGKDITTAVEKFVQGYADCQPQNGIPIPPPPSYASIAIGTNNNNLDGNAALTSGHAQAWANMVKAVQAYVVKNSLSGYVDVQGAIDLEPDWSTYSLAHDWASAYSGQAVSYLYNYGSTDGYPAVPTGEPTPVVPPPFTYSPWDSKQLYYLSGGLDTSGAGGVPGMEAMPQILQITFSKEWHAVSSWAVNSGRLPLQFAGEASASTLCPSITNGAGTGQCYTPQEAWQVFFHELSQQPLSGVSQLGDWSTDIKCSNGSTNQSCK